MCLFWINNHSVTAQNNINIILDELNINVVQDVLIDAKAINFGEYLDQNGLNAWYLNLNEAYIDIKPNNTVTISNISLTGGVDLQLWIFGQTLSGLITGSISGQLEFRGDENEGYSLFINSTDANLNYSGSFQTVVNLVNLLEYDITDFIPEIEISIGTSLLPEMALEYFKSGIPQISTNDNEIILTFEVLFADLNIKNTKVISGEDIYYRASNSILIEGEFLIEQGATFQADIIPKD